MKKTLILSLIIMVLLSACKKDKEEIAKEEISLKGKWNADSSFVTEYENGVLVNTESEAGDGTTFDFQSNDSLIIVSPGLGTESFPYTIQANSKVKIDEDIFEVRNLTASRVTLFIREDFAQGEFTEISFNLKR